MTNAKKLTVEDFRIIADPFRFFGYYYSYVDNNYEICLESRMEGGLDVAVYDINKNQLIGEKRCTKKRFNTQTLMEALDVANKMYSVLYQI